MRMWSLLRRELLLLLGLPVFLCQAPSACTFYTGCPTQPANSSPSGGSSTGSSGSSNGDSTGNAAGASGEGGEGGASSGDIVADRNWVEATGTLAGRSANCGVVYLSGHPSEDMLIAGLYQFGLWANTGGDKWTGLGTSGKSATITNGVNSIVYDPDHPTVFYEAGIYFGGGAYRTDDDGATFKQLGDASHIDSLGIDFTDPDRKTLVAGPHEKNQLILKSIDAGATWTQLTNLPTDLGFSANVLVEDAHTYLVGCINSIIRTTDGGDSWSIVSNVGGSRLPLKAVDGNIYWLAEGDMGMVRSTDGGESFERIVGSGMVGSNNNPVGLPDGRIAAIYSDHVVLSADQGVTWRRVGAKIPHVAKSFTYAPVRKAFFIGTDSCDMPIPDDAIMQLDFDYETE